MTEEEKTVAREEKNRKARARYRTKQIEELSAMGAIVETNDLDETEEIEQYLAGLPPQ